MRVVLDADIYISAFLKPNGLQSKLLKTGLQGKFQIVLSEKIFLEIRRALHCKKIADKLPLTLDEMNNMLDRLAEAAAWTEDTLSLAICSDSKDDIYLACAKESQADFLISGDSHLLKIKEFESTKIVTTAEFLDSMLRSRP